MIDAGQHKIFSSKKAYGINEFSTLKYEKLKKKKYTYLLQKIYEAEKI